MDGLLAQQAEDGSFLDSGGRDDPSATYIGALGLALKPLPLGRSSDRLELYFPFGLQWRQ